MMVRVPVMKMLWLSRIMLIFIVFFGLLFLIFSDPDISIAEKISDDNNDSFDTAKILQSNTSS